MARLAGVSPGTASKALNGRGGISADTAARVREAADRLGYQPNALARGLLTGRSFTVGLITTDSFGRFSIPVMQGAEDALGPGRIAVFLCDSRDDRIREQHYLRTLLERRVDGIIVTGRRQDPREPIGQGLPAPVVYAMTHSTDPGDLSLIPDDEQGGALAVQHLLSTGRASIGHVTGPRRFKAAVLRAAGAEKALAAAGLELAGGEPLFGEWTEEWGRQATDMLLRSQDHLDAIFCGNDQIARGVADALREAGRRVPDDVALVGFDNWEVMAEASRPPLTTVDMNLRELGRAAGERLLAAIEGRPSVGVQLLPCSLVVRESSRPRHPVVPTSSGVSEASEADGASGNSGAGGVMAPAKVPSQARVPSGHVPPGAVNADSRHQTRADSRRRPRTG
ncbi:MAG TPA: LacI family DNA-binding transcriptional regulator [Streptosporangiaceae bacterium]|nr:LacI family DNA-binding transcriptional regulator [Streptosporangiaceae bacterium]